MAQNLVSECIEDFMRRRYEECVDRSTAILADALDAGAPLDFSAVLLNVICLERTGHREQAFKHAVTFHDRLSTDWDRALMMLAIGRGSKGDPTEVVSMIGDKKDDEAAKKMWQMFFCFGAYNVSRHNWKAARDWLQQSILSGVPPQSIMEMMLMVVEYNYIFHGSAQSEFDEPLVDLNKKVSQTADLKVALVTARKALDLAEREVGRQHPARLNAVHNLAAVLAKLEQFKEALPYLEESVKLRRAACGELDEGFGEELELLAALNTRLGNRERAAECYSEVLQIAERKAAE